MAGYGGDPTALRAASKVFDDYAGIHNGLMGELDMQRNALAPLLNTPGAGKSAQVGLMEAHTTGVKLAERLRDTAGQLQLFAGTIEAQDTTVGG